MTHDRINNLVQKNHNFYSFFKSNAKINPSTLYIVDDLGYIVHRKNLENLELYLDLHKKNVIKNKYFQKDSKENIENKIKKFKELKNIKFLDHELKNNLNIFNSNNFEIKDFDSLFKIISKKFDYIAIIDGENKSEISNFVKKEFTLIKSSAEKNSNIYYFDHFLIVLDNISRKFNNNKLIYQFVFGDKYSLYKIN